MHSWRAPIAIRAGSRYPGQCHPVAWLAAAAAAGSSAPLRLHTDVASTSICAAREIDCYAFAAANAVATRTNGGRRRKERSMNGKPARLLCRVLLAAVVSIVLAADRLACAYEGRTVTRWIPVPTDVSAAAQAVLGGPLSPVARIVPKTTEEWQQIIREINEADVAKIIEPTRALYPVRIEQRAIGGVQTFEVTPKGPIAPENRNRVLINLHGGAYIVNPGPDPPLAATPVAHLLGLRVIAVDYRMPPVDPFPAALDDAVAVYGAVIEKANPATVGVYGTSAGGGLTAALLLKLRAMQ